MQVQTKNDVSAASDAPDRIVNQRYIEDDHTVDVTNEPIKDVTGKFHLSKESYDKWWDTLPRLDRKEFERLGGDVFIGRFICAFDNLSAYNIDSAIDPISLAYGIASEKVQHITQTGMSFRTKGSRILNHAATQRLLESIARRRTRARSVRVEAMTGRMLETCLDAVLKDQSITQFKMQDRVSLIRESIRFTELMRKDAKEQRELEAQIPPELPDSERIEDMHMSKEELEELARVVLAKLGKQNVLELAKSVE